MSAGNGSLTAQASDGIAVVGLGCRFPGGARDAESFWSLLRDGVDVIGEMPAARRALVGDYDAGQGGFLDGIEEFDAAFFGISPREAREMDPQQRLLLEVAWEAIEAAGQTVEDLAGSRTGVFVGMLGMDYTLLHSRYVGAGGIDQYYAAGREFSFGAGRLSYGLDLRGPSLTVSTACSSSLVAVHLACQSLRTGESDLCLAGGVNVMLSPELSTYLGKVGALSPTGRCKVFDASADGIVRGEGCGIVALKRLADARAAGDEILAVIRGSAVNHDGGSAGLTVPNGAAQQALLRDALAAANVSPAEVGYVEAHGTGTPLGDPIEVRSLAAVLSEGRVADRPIVLGSLKTNFGHTDAAAGVAGLIKVVLALRNGEIPPHLHLEKLNPLVRWDDLPVQVPRELLGWTGPGRIGAVSAFGLSGTNAHVLLEEAPAEVALARAAAPARQAAVALPVAARSDGALRELARDYARLLRAPASDSGELTDLAFAAATRRSHHRHRLVVVGEERCQVAESLEAFAAGDTGADLVAGEVGEQPTPRPVFVFSGQGSQWAGMGRALYVEEPVFAAAVDRCGEILGEHAGWSLRAALCEPAWAERLVGTDVAQPAIVSLQIALSALLRSWGVEPAAVVGHSVGEIAAAHVAGILDLEAAMTVAWHRGQVMHAAAGDGAMAAARLTREQAEDLLASFPATLWLAGINGPRSVVLSGTAEALDEAKASLAEQGVRVKSLDVDYAFHSGQMEPFAGDLASRLAGLEPGEPTVTIVPTVEGRGEGPDYGPAYWARGIAAPVSFAPAMERLLEDGQRVFLEVGPHPTLGHPISECMEHRGERGPVLASLRRDGQGRAALLRSVARLHVTGYPLQWRGILDQAGARVSLPAYPWQHERLWMDIAPGSVELPLEATPAVSTGSPGPGTRPDQPVDDPETPAVDPATLRAAVREVVAGVLGVTEVERVDVRRGFFDLGMDSVTALELRGILEERFRCSLPATVAFDHPTVERLADHLSTRARMPATTASAPQSIAVPASAPPQASAPARLRAGSGAADPARRPPAAEAVAVIGIGCRFPGGGNGPEGFWRVLRDGLDAVTEVPEGRPELLAAGIRFGAFLDEVDGFDAQYFQVSPREARAMDPQQRLFLEVASEALEHAGQVPDRLSGSRTGVFVGMNTNDYLQLLTRDHGRVDAYYGTGNSFCGAAGRLSYFLGLQGPSLAVDTACSGSLLAVHLACQSLASGESDLAVVGGVNVILSPTVYLSADDGGALAADGRCKTFDAAADGYGRGEGCGAVVLKPLSRALEDGDQVLAVIAGSATNSDGASSGLTVPNGPAQEALLASALVDAGLAPGAVSYVEAHGTGTPIGDPIEVGALTAVFDEPTRDRPLMVGSVKTNIGHLEAASGIAGLIKVVLALRHRELPASLHLETLNPEIARLGGVDVPVELTRWDGGGQPLVAGVSAFGFTGTNVHVVVTEAPAAGPEPTGDDAGEPRPCLLPLSANSKAALQAQAASYSAWLDRHDATETAGDRVDALADVCYTAALRRGHQRYRLGIVGSSRAGIAECLRAFVDDGQADGVALGEADPDAPPRTAFAFSGYGSQYDGMGRRMLAADAVFRAEVERWDDALGRHVDFSVRSLLEPGGPSLRRGDVPQEVIFVVQVALAAVWRARGVHPQAVVGHSVGEVAAAYVAGALTVEDAAHVLAERSRLLTTGLVGQGTMAVVGLSTEDVTELIAGAEDRLWVAVSNSPTSTVLSGESSALEDLLEDLRRRNVFCRPVEADGAGHSPYVDPLRDELVRLVAGVRPRSTTTTLYSTVTGAPVDGEALDAEYWGRNLRQQVRFSEAVAAMASEGIDTFVEVSPHPIVLTPIEQTLRHHGLEGLLLPSLHRDGDDEQVLLSSLAALHVRGAGVDWDALHPAGGRVVDLPPRAWQHKRYWLSETTGLSSDGQAGTHPLLTSSLQPAGQPTRYFEVTLAHEHLAGFGGAEIDGAHLLPASVQLEMVTAAGRDLLGSAGLHDLVLHAPLVCPQDSAIDLQLATTPVPGGATFTMKALRRDAAGRTSVSLLASGRLRRMAASSDTPDLEAVRAALDRGPAPEVAEQRVTLAAADRRQAAAYALHPALLSQALGVLAATTDPDGRDDLPLEVTGLEQARLFAGGGAMVEATVLATPLESPGSGKPAGDLRLFDDTGRLRAELLGVEFSELRGTILSPEARSRLSTRLYGLRWRVEAGGDEAAGTLPAGAPGDPDRWIVFADSHGAGQALADLVRARGGRCTVVEAGDRYEQVADGHVVCDPVAAEHLQRVVAGASPGTRLVYLWGTELDERALGGSTHIPAAGYTGLLHLVQALKATAPSQRPPLWVVTRGAQPVETPGPLAPVALAQAPLWGMAATAALEMPESTVVLVDLDPCASSLPGDDIEQLARLLGNPVRGEDRIALRGGDRHVARLARRQPVGPLATPPPVRPDGSYLVIEGEGATGRRVASWLAARGAGRVVLARHAGTGETTSPGAGDADGLPEQVELVKADLDTEEGVSALVERAGGNALRGVLCAVTDFGLRQLEQLSAEQLAEGFTRRAGCAWRLHVQTAASDLDFFVMFSSAASVWGSVGMARAAFAEGFLDALAHERHRQGLAALSINWVQWDDDVDAGTRAAMAGSGLRPYPGDEALEALEELIGAPDPQVAVADVDWGLLKPMYEAARPCPVFAEVEPAADRTSAGGTTDLVGALTAADRERGLDLLCEHLAETVAGILGIEDPADLDPDEGFFELGMNSVMALELKVRLERTTGLALPATLAFECPTVLAVAGYLAGDLLAPADDGGGSAGATEAGRPQADAPTGDVVDEVADDISDEELLARLEAELATSEQLLGEDMR